MAKKAQGATYTVLERYRTVVNGPWFDKGRVVEVGVDHTQGEIDLLMRAGKLEPGGKKKLGKAPEPEPDEGGEGDKAEDDAPAA